MSEKSQDVAAVAASVAGWVYAPADASGGRVRPPYTEGFESDRVGSASRTAASQVRDPVRGADPTPISQVRDSVRSADPASSTNAGLVQLGLPGRISRRQAMQWVMATAAASALPGVALARPIDFAPTSSDPSKTGPKGYGTDPNLVKVHHPGDLWPLTLSDAQRKIARALADVMLPKDEYGPAASEVGVVEMLDEWISAPYPQQQADRPIILDGLKWLAAESNKRFSHSFEDLSIEQQHAICDDICFASTARPVFHKAASFFTKFRSLSSSAYYATPAGWKAIGYVGNIPLASFDGPPAEVLEKLGVTQTVK